MSKTTKRRKIIITFTVILTIIILLVGACAIYVMDYYRTDEEAIDAFFSTDTYLPREICDNAIAFEPENPTAAFIFYPGGKVDHKSYYPLMRVLSERGILAILIEMPFRLAVLDINAADGLKEMYPDIENWYIGGHSLGGSMAAAYLSENEDDFKGLILLGSYSTKDFSNSDIRALSIYGSEDGVMNKEKYDKNLDNMPTDFEEYIIDGGCHAYFGMYGEQDGDGTPRVSNEEQIYITADKIHEFISK